MAPALHHEGRATSSIRIGTPVTPCELADLATVVAAHAEALSAAGGPEPATLHRVWKRSVRCLRAWREELFSSATPALYAEIFSAELPIRIWCTAVTSSGVATADNGGSAIAAKVFADLLELRCMALQALAADHGLTASEAANIDRFRRRCERWCDVLLGPLVGRTGVTDYTVHPDRAADFAERFSADPSGKAAWQLMTAGLRLAFAESDGFRGFEHHRDGNATTELASALFASFPTEAFSSTGRLRDPQVTRLCRVTQEGVPAGRPQKRRGPMVTRSSHDELEAPASQPPHVNQSISFANLRKRHTKQ